MIQFLSHALWRAEGQSPGPPGRMWTKLFPGGQPSSQGGAACLALPRPYLCQGPGSRPHCRAGGKLCAQLSDLRDKKKGHRVGDSWAASKTSSSLQFAVSLLSAG